MADQDPISGSFDIEDQLRRRQLLQSLPNIAGVNDTPEKFQQLLSQANQPQPATMPAQPPPPQQPATITPWEVQQPPVNPYQSQMGEINKSIEDLTKRGQDLTTLAGQKPTLGQYKISKLRAGLLMPLQILAGAAGRDTSEAYGNLIHPGFTKDMSAYQAKMEAAQKGYDTLGDVIKDRLDALKAEGTITNQQSEALYRQAEANIKNKELEKLPLEEDKLRAETELARTRARTALIAKPSGNMAIRLFDKALQDYSLNHEGNQPPLDLYKKMAEDAERTASLPVTERQEALKQRELLRDSQKVNRDNNKKVLDPLELQISNLMGLGTTINTGLNDKNKIAQSLSLIEAVSTLSNPLTRITRYNSKEIEALRRAPGRLEAAVATAKNLLGQGSPVPPEVLRELKPFVDIMIDELRRQRDVRRKANEEIDNAKTPQDSDAAIARRDKALDDLYDLSKVETKVETTAPPKEDPKVRLRKINEALRKKP